MPVYEYKCNACGREFEVQQRMSDPELTDCEVCGKPALERLISRTAFTLKGGGWYKDLYSSTKPAADGASSTKPTDGASSAPAATPAPSDDSNSGTGSSTPTPAATPAATTPAKTSGST